MTRCRCGGLRHKHDTEEIERLRAVLKHVMRVSFSQDSAYRIAEKELAATPDETTPVQPGYALLPTYAPALVNDYEHDGEDTTQCRVCGSLFGEQAREDLLARRAVKASGVCPKCGRGNGLHHDMCLEQL